MSYSGTFYTGQYQTPAQIDALKSTNIATPNGTNVVNTNAIDLEAGQPYPTTEELIVNLVATIGTGANSKNINYALQHTNANSDGTADNGNWANIPELAIQVIAGNTTNTGAMNVFLPLPPKVKRYIRGTCVGEANGGLVADATFTVQLLF